MTERSGALVRVSATCWRAVAAGLEGSALNGTVKPGRYNRPGERTLYMSGSLEGVAAAMGRYGDAERALVRLAVDADGLADLRDGTACATLGIDPARAGEDWMQALRRGEGPASWVVADRARAVGATGLIDPSRRAPGLWHLVLFRWEAGVSVRIV